MIASPLLRKRYFATTLFLLVPLVLSAYTHLWNSAGFPSFHPDEGHYIRRALHVLEGGSPEEKLGLRGAELSQGGAPYDHPFFGQILLAGIMALVGYPESFGSFPDFHSIEVLNQIPRIIVGSFAILDTFLVYKIADLRYSRKAGFISALLFAVMPISWLTHRVWLDNLQLPFMLSALLLIVYLNRTPTHNHRSLILISSGVLLGLAIFIKIPAFLFIPLFVFLIHKESKRGFLKDISLLLVPVILIPAIWPAFAMLNGEFNIWIEGILWQASGRADNWVTGLRIFFIMDPIFSILGIAGIVYSVLRKDLLPSILFFTFLFFYLAIGYASYFHFIPLVPALSISGARLIADLPGIFRIRKRFVGKAISYIVIAEIGAFGLINTGMLINMNFTSHQLQATDEVIRLLSGTFDTIGEEGFINGTSPHSITLVGNPYYHWVPQKVFHIDQIYTTYLSLAPFQTQYFIIIVDDRYHESMLSGSQSNRLTSLYNSTRSMAVFKGPDLGQYVGDSYVNEIIKRNIEQSVEIRTNY